MKNFKDISYSLHGKEYSEHLSPEKEAIVNSWLNENTIDHWRHERMIAPIKPILSQFPRSKWLTVGDGRLGLDSIKLKNISPGIDILPTDISPFLLEFAKKKGLIKDFKTENAEHLSFSDEEFEFCFCKESYHHFPRPAIALYEMLRVASKAVILIEPNDLQPKPFLNSFISGAKNFVKKTIGKTIYHSDHWKFEEAGNYVYSVSKREIEKTALGLQLPAIAISYFNDHYEEGIEFEDRFKNDRLFRKIKNKISKADRKCRSGLASPSVIIAVIFKEMPSSQLISELKKNKFEFIILPSNPYLKEKNITS